MVVPLGTTVVPLWSTAACTAWGFFFWQLRFYLYPLFSVDFLWLASGSTAGAHGSTAYAVVPLGTSVALPLGVSPSVQLSVACLS